MEKFSSEKWSHTHFRNVKSISSRVLSVCEQTIYLYTLRYNIDESTVTSTVQTKDDYCGIQVVLTLKVVSQLFPPIRIVIKKEKKL